MSLLSLISADNFLSTMLFLSVGVERLSPSLFGVPHGILFLFYSLLLKFVSLNMILHVGKVAVFHSFVEVLCRFV